MITSIHSWEYSFFFFLFFFFFQLSFEQFTLQYGRIDPQDPNSNFIDHNRTLHRLLGAVGNELNLKVHKIIADGVAKEIALSSEIQGHECSDGRLYAVRLVKFVSIKILSCTGLIKIFFFFF